MKPIIHFLKPSEIELIEQIADWYQEGFSISRDRTISRLQAHPNDDIIFQIVIFFEGKPVASGGLYYEVGLLRSMPQYRTPEPWVAVLYTDPEYRKKGLGTLLLKEIEEESWRRGFEKLYLYTFTAEQLYLMNNWKEVERLIYKGHDTVIMEKKSKGNQKEI